MTVTMKTPPRTAADELLREEWNEIVERTPEAARRRIAAHVREHMADLAERYGKRAAGDPDVSGFLVTQASRRELALTVHRWLAQLLCDDTTPIEERIAQQRAAGEALARLNYPIQAVARGARKLRSWIIDGLRSAALPPDRLLDAAAYVGDLLDLSVELRTTSYVKDAARQSRIDEAYRMHSLGQNIAVERERQRASLMEWGHGVLVDLHRDLNAPLPRLAQSEFGLWLSHRATTLFEGASEVGLIAEAVQRIDHELLPRLDPVVEREFELMGALVEQLQNDLAAIKFNVTGLFEQQIEVENGRDTLTRLLNRRFLSTVLGREIALHRRSGGGCFSVLLLDIDHFKGINDTHGHDGGDVVLQQAAALVMGGVRPSDFVFRYGGEEILVVLVESDLAVARQVAESLRVRFESTAFALSSGTEVGVTVSIGVAQYEGRPDYQPLLAAADGALYRAKEGGRNRVEAALG